MTDPIRITGAHPQQIARGPLEAARGTLGVEGPLCRAPDSVLVLDANGAVFACEATSQPLQTRRATDLFKVWASRARGAIAHAVAAGELPAGHCAVCIAALNQDLPDASAILRDHGLDEPVAGSTGPSRLLVRLDRGPRRLSAEALAQRALSVVDSLSVLELEVGDPSGHGRFAAMVAMLAQRPADARPVLRLRVARIASPASVAAALDGLVIDAVVATDPVSALDVVSWSHRLRRGGEALSVSVRFVLGPDHWFDLVRLAPACAAAGVTLDLRATDADGHAPLTGLSAGEARFVVGQLGTFWDVLGSAQRPASIGEQSYDRMLREARRILLGHLREHLYSGADDALHGTGAVLAMPPVEHPMLTEECYAVRLLNWFVGLTESRGLCAWAREVASRKDILTIAKRPWIRIMLCRAARLEPGQELFAAVARIYDRRGREAWLREERELAASSGIVAQVDELQDWLGTTRLRRRRRPIQLRAAPALDAATAPPEVTVLIPSYGHETFVRDAVRSVLAQTQTSLSLRLIDDRSTDRTVERAREIEDPRFVSTVNDRNLGLANSLLAALDDVSSPYVAILNSDDLFHPERLAKCCAVLDADADASLVATDLFLVDEQGGELHADNVSRLRDGPLIHAWVNWYRGVRPDRDTDLFRPLLEANFLATSSNIVCRTDFLRREAQALKSLKYCLDWHLFLIAALEGGLRYLPEKLAAYRLHGANTVWFDSGRRWPYFLEVSRVAAMAIERQLAMRTASGPADDAVADTIRCIAEHVDRNSEVQGLALFTAGIVGGEDFDRVAHRRDDAAAAVQVMQRTAQTATELRYGAERLGLPKLRDALAQAGRLPTLQLSRHLALTGVDESDADRRGEAAARVQLAQERRTVGDLMQLRDRLAAALGGFRARVEAAGVALPAAAAKGDPIASWTATFGAIAGELEQRGAGLTARQEQVAKLETDLADLQRQYDEADGERRRQRETERAMAAAIDDLQAEQIAARVTCRQLETRAAALEDRLAESSARAGQLGEQLRNADELRKGLRQQLVELRREQAERQRELERMTATPEWRIGYALWRKTPFFAKSRRGLAALYRRMRPTRGTPQTGPARPITAAAPAGPVVRIAATTTGRFPVLSHTFVYQELLALHQMFGAELCLFHRIEDENAHLHEAFRYLDAHRRLIPSQWEVHKSDYEHYRRTRPARVEALMRSLAEFSGLDRSRLESHFEVMYAFTYARRVEDWGADYLHSYFFYDASLQALVASWVLGLPRGVSTYADHMIDDWDLKVVPLHLRTASIVVATSRRIRDELISLGGPQIAGKVIVKPNGVDGTRFPFIRRSAAVNRPFELVVVSRLEPKKGMLELVESARLLRERGRSFRLHIIGAADSGNRVSVEYAAEFERRIAAAGLDAQILRHGALLQQQIRPILDAADAFVAPFVETERGDKDGIPTAILEAMSSGLPVVATDAGSIPEVIDDGVEGLIVPQRDPLALADAIDRLIADPARALQFGTAGRARFDRDFDIRATEPRLHDCLRAVLAGQAAQAKQG